MRVCVCVVWGSVRYAANCREKMVLNRTGTIDKTDTIQNRNSEESYCIDWRAYKVNWPNLVSCSFETVMRDINTVL